MLITYRRRRRLIFITEQKNQCDNEKIHAGKREKAKPRFSSISRYEGLL
jgi:hypothetical protein